jgi:anion-transporting  ArsA/GET3 family ATPase
MAARTSGLMQLLAAKEMVVVCGSGGTGKTTIAAALGARAARDLGGRVLVLTVDPARRLATALGLDGISHDPVRVSAPRGELWVAMLDTKAGWDELITRHAPDPARREQVLANPLYQNITGRFVHSHDYIAMEKLHELHSSGDYDLVIIDTPPSRNALDLLDAPRRMKEFFRSRLLRWLTVPYRSRLFTAASKPFYQVADRVLGSRFLQDIAEFFILFQSMEQGFVARADQIESLLTDDRTTFVVVTTLEAAPTHESRFLIDELNRRSMPLGAVVVNRSLPAKLAQPAVARTATALAALASDGADPLLARLAGDVDGDSDDVASVLRETGERFRQVAVIAAREAERRRDLEGVAPLLGDVPTQPGDVHDLDGLLAVADALR